MVVLKVISRPRKKVAPPQYRSTPGGLRLFLRLLSRSRFRPSRGRAGVSLGLGGWLWFVRVIRVPACARVSRVSRVCVNFKTGRHRTAALKRARPRGGAPT